MQNSHFTENSYITLNMVTHYTHNRVTSKNSYFKPNMASIHGTLKCSKSTGTRRPGEGGVLPPSSASRRGRLQEKFFFFHNRRRNVRRNVHAKSPWRAGNGDAIWTDLRNVGPRGYRPARVARARAGSRRPSSAGRRGRFEEKIFSSRYRDAVACVP